MEQLIQFIKELNTPLPSQSSQVSKVNSSSIESQSFSNSKIGSITG